MSSSDRCYLLELPAEIRLIVYEFYFYDISIHINLPSKTMATLAQDECFDFAAPVREKTRLLATTRQLLPEAFPVFKTVAKVCAKVLEAEITAYALHLPRKREHLSIVNMTTPTSCCCLLELPPEVRLMIYRFCFDGGTFLKQDTLVAVLAKPMHLVADSTTLAKKVTLLSVSRQLLHEAFPIYKKFVQAQIQDLMLQRDKHQPWHWSPSWYIDMDEMAEIGKLDRAINVLEWKLAKCQNIIEMQK